MKKIMGLLFGVLLSFSLFGNSAFASEIESTTGEYVSFSPDSESNDDSVDNIISTRALWYLSYNLGYQGKHYGKWKNGTTGEGKATLTFSKSVNTSNTFTGTLAAPIKQVNASVGFNITKSDTTSASYSVLVPKGKKYTIQWRNVYKKYKVRQQGYSGSVMLDSKYVYPLKYDHVEYRVKK
ncbi:MULTISPECIES: hypothetical protein [Bacteria]|uniref:hypothetical protein n=1 Tax=Bacteria TaxID=2 RepID=UPI001C123A8D|nr:hypothetical protein [Bacillus safensis]MBU5206601.1 hypothetical protein [Bacillus safensis]